MLIKCPECNNEVEDTVNQCPNCGYPIKKETDAEKVDGNNNSNAALPAISHTSKDSETKSKLKVLETLSKSCSIILIIISAVFFYKGYDVKNNYYNSEYSTTIENAYVGGDAYNYIINGTYFTGYMVLGSGCLIGSIILFGIDVLIKIRDEKNEE